jgi:hypothetical protein
VHVRLGAVPPQYIDPSRLASLYPPSTKPSLPDSFVAPRLARENLNAPAAASGLLLGAGLLALGAYWATRKR